MPPKIREMTANFNSPQNGGKRFTLMVSGEDALDLEDGQSLSHPPMGLPHERFLLGNAVPIAPVLLLGQSSQAINPQEYIACLQPVHLHATRDHLVLMSQDQIDLTTEESHLLLKTALPFIEEDFQSKVLFQGQHYWFIPAGPFTNLSTHSIDQAHGRNIDWWMPRDSNESGIAKRWRKLQNEVQMLWHIDPVNESREQRGLPSINSLWISGIGKLADLDAPEVIRNANYLCGSHPILVGLAKHYQIEYNLTIKPKDLSQTFAWLENPAAIWPLLNQALLEKHLDEVLVIDFPSGKKRERIFTNKNLHKPSWMFWKKSEALSWHEIAQQ
jgi:hypothetical protein